MFVWYDGVCFFNTRSYLRAHPTKREVGSRRNAEQPRTGGAWLKTLGAAVHLLESKISLQKAIPSRQRTKLSINLNKVALLRNSRSVGVPDILEAARVCLEAGADGITVHPRPDQRHIRPADVHGLARLLRTDFPEAELNIEGNPFTDGYLALVEALAPTQCTLVPDTPEQATSDHGWEPVKDGPRLKPIIEALKKKGCRVSLFMDPQTEWIAQLKDSPADRLELYTESYAAAYANVQKREELLAQFTASAQAAKEMGLGINAGHDLNSQNLRCFLTRVPDVLEVSVGHALISDAVFLGLEGAVKQYLQCLEF